MRKLITLVRSNIKIKTMKKIISLCFFVFAVGLGTQTLKAQNIIEINAVAAEKTKELKQALKFDANTEHQVYKVYQAYERKKLNIDRIVASGKTVSEDDKMAFNNMLAERFKKILTATQYERYLIYSKSPK